MPRLARLLAISSLLLTLGALGACGDDDGSGGGTDAGSDGGPDAGPMCLPQGEGCSFTPCCEGFCCCVAVGDGGTCGYQCIAERMGTCR